MFLGFNLSVFLQSNTLIPLHLLCSSMSAAPCALVSGIGIDLTHVFDFGEPCKLGRTWQLQKQNSSCCFLTSLKAFNGFALCYISELSNPCKAKTTKGVRTSNLIYCPL